MGFTKDQFELLAPGGDLDSIKAAIAAGADAVYCGLDRFNARNRATNITLDVLDGVVELAHNNHCKIFLTLNIVVLESEIPSLIRLLKQLSDTDVDGVIVQDLGLAYLIKYHFPQLDMHASTQMNTHNEGQIQLLSKLGSSRVNLSRELNIDEIAHLAQFGRAYNVAMEVFVHGSYCIGFSGLCYFSSELSGASGNRGRCSQPCRDQYQTTTAGNNYPLNLKDNSAYQDMDALAKAGVYSLKVEGRIKKSHYVYTVVDNWRKQIDHYCQTDEVLIDMSELYTVFNRDFTNGYLKGDIHRGMYIDNPRNFAAKHFDIQSKSDGGLQAKKFVYDRNTDIIRKVDSITVAMPITSNSKRSLKGCGYKVDVELPKFDATAKLNSTPKLSVLVDNVDDLELIDPNSDVEFFYHIPDALDLQYDEVMDAFSRYPNLIPYFPAILIGEHYQAACRLLDHIKPRWLVTNNLGMAEVAKSMGLSWIAGPQLNITNSLSLLCVQEELKGNGAYISNELSAKQMKRLVRPEGFKLFYSIYHPIHLMTSRQCLLIQSIGCKKQRMNKGCMKRCEKSASIISLKGQSHVIHKQRGNHNCLFGNENFLNLDLLTDVPDVFTDIMIDLRDVPTHTQLSVSKSELIHLFKQALTGEEGAQQALRTHVSGTTNRQYLKGLS
ncbi:peptidase U32 family protein [Vibrio ziniensis]|uniref:U32 family peptidase n=1 Tax=Vibrio ziniensis TaxID=2711221 RepID=A0A6G7CQN6_9VIBR|nr:peptidase U32 family protein [Vibrio ziniensis]QIH44425.1 U32 family peptidase [Vibrio ziniensis]